MPVQRIHANYCFSWTSYSNIATRIKGWNRYNIYRIYFNTFKDISEWFKDVTEWFKYTSGWFKDMTELFKYTLNDLKISLNYLNTRLADLKISLNYLNILRADLKISLNYLNIRLQEWFKDISQLFKYTETCQKYSVTVIFYYIFHIKPPFLETLFQSQFLCDFDEIFTNRSENVRSFFGSTDFKCSWLKHKLKLFVFKYTIIVLYFWRSKFSFVFKSWAHKNYRLLIYAKITV